jgi:uncharacterized membrane protein
VITDRQVEISIAILLRTGVFLAAAVVLIGGVLYLAHSGDMRSSYHVFHGEPSDLRSPGGVLREALSGRPDAIIELGLLLRILTPLARANAIPCT